MTKEEFKAFIGNPPKDGYKFLEKYLEVFGKLLIPEDDRGYSVFDLQPIEYKYAVAKYALDRGKPFNSGAEIAVELFGYTAKEYEDFTKGVENGEILI